MKRRARWLRIAALNAIVILAGGELLARWLVPAARWSAASNIYRARPGSAVGYTLAPNYHGDAFGVPLDTNSLGFRGPEWSAAKTPGTFRVALVGDSHAFGYGVRYEESLGPRLAGALGPRAEVLVFAAPGYDSAQEAALVRDEVWRFQPDLIVVYVCSNDAEPPLTVDDEGFLHWEHDAARVTAANRVLDEFHARALPKPSWLTRHSRLWLALQLMLQRSKNQRALRDQLTPPEARWMTPLRHPELVPLLPAVKEPLVALARDARAHGVPVALLLYAADLDYRRTVEEVAREEDVPLLELLTLLPDVRSDSELVARYGLGWDSHLGPAAHRIFADGAARFIRERRLLPTTSSP